MKTNILTLVITMVVGVILAGSLLAPIVTDAQHAQDVTYTNTASSYGKIYEFDETDENDTVIISVCKTGERSISINGTTYNVNAWQPVIVSDGFSIRYYSTAMTLSTLNGPQTIIDATITISQGVATFTNVHNSSETEVTIASVPVSWAFVYTPDGDYSGILTEQTATVYTHKNEIYTGNWINTTSEYFSGKAGDDFVTITNGNGSRTATLNWGGEYLNNGVYKLTIGPNSDDYSFVVDNAGEDYTVHPFMIVVPKEVVGTPDSQKGINSLYGSIVVIALAAILMSGVGAIALRRND